MGRTAKDYTVIRRPGSPYWYAKVEGGPWWSTRTANYFEARSRAKEAYDAHVGKRRRRTGETTVREFIVDFYDWDKCRRVARIRDEGKRISRGWCFQQVSWRKAHIEPDEIADMRMSEVIRADVLEFRMRLRKKGLGTNTVNKVARLVKTIFAEAVYEGLIDSNPADGIGSIQYHEDKPDPFSREELGLLFPDRLRDPIAQDYAPWEGLQDYCAFLLAATTGMRRGEILGLRWRSVDWDRGVIAVVENWKKIADVPGDHTGDVKWGGKHDAVASERVMAALRAIHNVSKHNRDHDYVFASPGGKVRRDRWWASHFQEAIKRAGIDTTGRRLVPHSLRHTITTLLTEAGVPDILIRHTVGGWTSVRTQSGYVHVGAMETKVISETLSSLF